VRRAALVVLGAYVGILGALVHRHTWRSDGTDWPWGLVLTVLVTYVVVVAADRVAPVGGAWFGLGWAIVLMGQQLSSGAGYLVADDWLGWSFTIGSVGAIVLGVVRPPRLGA
jgi:hypothetical protein